MGHRLLKTFVLCRRSFASSSPKSAGGVLPRRWSLNSMTAPSRRSMSRTPRVAARTRWAAGIALPTLPPPRCGRPGRSPRAYSAARAKALTDLSALAPRRRHSHARRRWLRLHPLLLPPQLPSTMPPPLPPPPTPAPLSCTWSAVRQLYMANWAAWHGTGTGMTKHDTGRHGIMRRDSLVMPCLLVPPCQGRGPGTALCEVSRAVSCS